MKGSQDDMSLAGIFDELEITKNLDIYKNWRLHKLDTEIEEKRKRVEKFGIEKKSKVAECESAKNNIKQYKDRVSLKNEKYEKAKQDFFEHEKKISALRENLAGLLNFFSSKKQIMLDAEKELQRAEHDLEDANKDLQFSEKSCQITENELQTEIAELHKLLKKKTEMEN
jgi:chromosome segregation ATPase